jgi:YVTN family beta-propeller protein
MKYNKKAILYIIITIISIVFIYWISHIKHINLTAGNQSFTSISSGIIYDGSNVWIANPYQTAISKYDLSFNLITQFTNIGSALQLLSAGAYIWASNYESGYVNKINKNTGSIEATIVVGEGPIGMAFDGTNIWVCNYGSASCSVISQSSNTVIETIDLESGPTCALFDGTNIWISCSISGVVYAINPTSLGLINKLGVGKMPYRMTTMNGDVYVLDINSNYIYKINTETIIEGFTKSDFVKCNDIVNDGKNLYIASLESNIYKINMSDKKLVGFGSSLNSIEYIQIVQNNIIVNSTNQFELLTTNGKSISESSI